LAYLQAISILTSTSSQVSRSLRRADLRRGDRHHAGAHPRALRVELARSRAEASSLDGEIERLYGLLLAEPQSSSPGTAAPPRRSSAILRSSRRADRDRIMTYALWLRPEQAFLLMLRWNGC